MSTTSTSHTVPLETLRKAISSCLAINVKAYNLPSVGERLGLATGTSEEAHRSKGLYVGARIIKMNAAELRKLAGAIVTEFGDERLSDLLGEMELSQEARVSELTRRDMLKALNPLESLFGETDLFAGLNIISTERLGGEEQDGFGFLTLTGNIVQHCVKNLDWSNEELLTNCGALSCSQRRFFRLIEKLLDPVVRRGEDQTQLSVAINKVLSADGFQSVVTEQKSGHPVYSVQRTRPGVEGKPKNLIFASINSKPDLYFLDAINNDVGIRNPTDALIFDEFLLNTGLRWESLANWWQVREGLDSGTKAKQSLYRRLRESVIHSGSPGQYAMFDTYYREFADRLKERLPALIPEVYLHYDPKTRLERGADPALLRQRMDMLLLLDQNARIVIEVDGSHHYSDREVASPKKYAQMVEEDRRLRLLGYELYRFGGAEFADTEVPEGGKIKVGPKSKKIALEFFERLWKRHGLSPL